VSNPARLRRAAENQSLFRAVNSSLEELNETFGTLTEVGDWICECPDPACVERIAMTLEEYERVRDVPTHFAVKPGHEAREVEDVVERHDGYFVVEKVGVAALVAVAHDPRAEE
jgi:hypothetical protein